MERIRRGARMVFAPGHRKGGGRPKGVPNKTTRVLREAIILAAESVGENGKGRDGLVGYLIRVAKRDIKSFSSLLGRTLPYTITGPNNGPVRIISESMSATDAAQAYADTLRAPPASPGMVQDEQPGVTRH